MSDHLDNLLIDVEVPWYRSLLGSIKDLFVKLPLLEVTSKPVVVDSIWGLYRRQKRSFVISTTIQVILVLSLLITATTTIVNSVSKPSVIYTPVEIEKIVTTHPKILVSSTPEGNSGGGDRSPLPASYGKLPKFALQQFTPPVAVYNNMNPKLAMEPTLLGDPNTKVPNIDYPLYGNPLSHYMTPSNGTGTGGGIGDAKKGNGGVGNEIGTGGTVGAYRSGTPGIIPPSVISKVDPVYTDDARKARLMGTVVMNAVVDATGHVTNMEIVHGLGLGLNEAAMQSAGQWLFVPGKQGNLPVAVQVQISVTFVLL